MKGNQPKMLMMKKSFEFNKSIVAEFKKPSDKKIQQYGHVVSISMDGVLPKMTDVIKF